MWRADSPVRRDSAQLTVVSTDENEAGDFRHIVRVLRPDDSVFPPAELKKFDGGVVETPQGDQVVPAKARLTWRTISVADNGTTEVVSTSGQSPEGSRDLVADPHHRGNWVKLDVPVNAKPPLIGTLAANAERDLFRKGPACGRRRSAANAVIRYHTGTSPTSHRSTTREHPGNGGDRFGP